MKKAIVTMLSLLVTAALFYAFPFEAPHEADMKKGVSITRVWIAEDEKQLLPWLKKISAEYENQAGERVYIRSCTATEAQTVRENQKGLVLPDVLLASGQLQVIALEGYALFLRDETAEKSTPMPTGALFFRPSPQPEAVFSPAPMPSLSALNCVLVPEGWPVPLENAVFCPDPAGAFSAGTGEAAVLTAAQAEKLPFAVRTFALSSGFIPLTAGAFSPSGEQYLSFLQEETAQRALSGSGLFSVLPGLALYDAAAQPIRALIEGSRFAGPGIEK